AVRRGVTRALVSCDVPWWPLRGGTEAAVWAASRLVGEGAADMLKLDAAADFPDAVRAIAAAGIPVWAQFGITPHTARAQGTAWAGRTPPEIASEMSDRFVAEAQLL